MAPDDDAGTLSSEATAAAAAAASAAAGEAEASLRRSIYQVSRELDREQRSLFNCLASIAADAAFVAEMVALFAAPAALPVLANLRCGLWYAPRFDGAAYFKSTDGHNGNWSFSTTRLNWHVAQAAAERGGALLVDATRRGKTFPVRASLSPGIWRI